MVFSILNHFSFIEKWLILKTMKNSPYVVIPLHHRPDLMKQCCDLLNSEWHRSDTARLISLKKSCDDFPTCLVLMNSDIVVGHCKISLIPSINNSCFIESVLINQDFRCQGLGSLLLKEVENYAYKRGINTLYLMTKGQEDFYSKNGYEICEPIDLFNYTDISPDPITRSTIITNSNNDKKQTCTTAPLPPPMPVKINKAPIQILPNRTFMMKKLEIQIR